MPIRRHGGGVVSSILGDAYCLPRVIGETMECLDVLIALRKASESHATGKRDINWKGLN